MRIGFAPLLLLSAATAASLLTSCSSSANLANQSGGSGSNPAPTPTKTAPVLNWSQPADITSGTALSAIQLNATANVDGSFAYTPSSGTVLGLGSHTLSVTFTPADTADYTSASASVTLKVDPLNTPISSSNCTSGLSNGSADFLYVSTGAGQTGPYAISGYAPQPDGSLVPVAGSPFATSGTAALNTTGAGSTFFGVDGYTLYSYGVHADGCLSLENSAAIGQGPQNNPAALPLQVFLSPDAANLYSYNFVPSEESYFGAYGFNAGSGAVTPLGNTETDMSNDGGNLAFDSTGRYAVSSSCSDRGGMTVQVFQRASDGTLSTQAINFAPLPDMGPASAFCPYGATPDHTGHFVVAGFGCNDPMPCGSYGPYQLAVYTIDASGQMTTSSTKQNMPVLDALSPGAGAYSYRFSPDDRYFAVSGFTGLEVFSWDSASATLTHIATVNNTEGSCTGTWAAGNCSGNKFGNVAWDRNDRLYTFLGNQLFVYNVTDSGITQAPGSPHAIDSPQWLTVVSATGH